LKRALPEDVQAEDETSAHVMPATKGRARRNEGEGLAIALDEDGITRDPSGDRVTMARLETAIDSRNPVAIPTAPSPAAKPAVFFLFLIGRLQLAPL
jgi:hypothetical protein